MEGAAAAAGDMADGCVACGSLDPLEERMVCRFCGGASSVCLSIAAAGSDVQQQNDVLRVGADSELSWLSLVQEFRDGQLEVEADIGNNSGMYSTTNDDQ